MPHTSNYIDSQVAILYASQTGNAESISYNIYEDAVKRGFSASWHVLDDYEKFKFNELRTVVFVVSTTGDGDPPDNSARFWRVLRKATRSNTSAYSHLRFTILGLGDTNYSNFCNTAQRLDKQLLAAGATAFYPKGLADDATGLEETVEPWIDGLWPALAQVAQCSQQDVDQATDQLSKLDVSTDAQEPEATKVQISQPLLLDFQHMAQLTSITGVPRASAPVCSVVYVDEKSPRDISSGAVDMVSCPPWYKDLLNSNCNDPSLTPFISTIVSAKQITAPEALKRTLVMDLELSDTDSQHVKGCWRAGDAFNIYAPNDTALVAAIIAKLGIKAHDAQRPLHLEKKDAKMELPAHLRRFTTAAASIQDILLWSVDLSSLPRKPLLRALAEYCSENSDRQRLLYLCSKQGLKTFEALRAHMPTILDLLHAFPSCTPPPERLIELLPPLAPRSYSICNAPQMDATKWRIAFNVVEYELEIEDPFSRSEDSSSAAPALHRVSRRGVCTPWLEQLAKSGSKSRILVAKRPNLNAFHLPALADIPQRPVLMVGPGTGVAPFIGFLEQRFKELQQSADAAPFTWLFFGCRSSVLDYLFKADIQQFVDNKTLSRLSVCFSRDSDARAQLAAEKYVQDAMLKHADEIADLMLNQNALLFVCGDAKGMGKDVNDALATIVCMYAAKHPHIIPSLLESLPKSKLPVDLDASQLSKAQALQVLMQWSVQKRYVRDLWA
ncbi:hypothetical protein IWW36_001666 [Coemansia brasiliensis]|uniref:Methionine synthase reductase n=1 Tax=Coemansia brasiliensis TaxID=2650707 RepID=A0A9W8IGC7_9FUNG|nr:hypothetical protein IWW36_001666 [Coemansia brasiliensis]